MALTEGAGLLTSVADEGRGWPSKDKSGKGCDVDNVTGSASDVPSHNSPAWIHSHAAWSLSGTATDPLAEGLEGRTDVTLGRQQPASNRVYVCHGVTVKRLYDGVGDVLVSIGSEC
ncbi:hypothetical protein L202_05742 [Cryptococcus amylolentus CBS 6039]|uniref:Uncharacterized protein n=1 Tax=Cryptococcus amylolentus CBS 6039 TaxID=1295533 RepID=A0A1E3HLL7_9TREE|nr:hypothetical protein L202_05742 [Cryptococcus amylolentus CBS 6039]ODN77224.1 hypothetical protein L202_05742 [Cryptococcus amylolentus CBS 6039]